MPIFERFTDRSRRVLVLAQEQARLLDHDFIGTEHILLGLICEGEGVAAQALAVFDITLEVARDKVVEIVGVTDRPLSSSLPITSRAKKVLEFSLREALQLGHSRIGTEHILLGVVREGEGGATRVLVSLGADLLEVRQQVIQLLAGFPPGELPRPRPTVLDHDSATGFRCLFCSRRLPETGRLVASGGAAVCEQCIAEWAERLSQHPDEGDTVAGEEVT